MPGSFRAAPPFRDVLRARQEPQASPLILRVMYGRGPTHTDVHVGVRSDAATCNASSLQHLGQFPPIHPRLSSVRRTPPRELPAGGSAMWNRAAPPPRGTPPKRGTRRKINAK